MRLRALPVLGHLVDRGRPFSRMAIGQPGGCRYGLWRNPEDLTERQERKLAWIAKVNTRLYRAYLMKEQLTECALRVAGSNHGEDIGHDMPSWPCPRCSDGIRSCTTWLRAHRSARNSPDRQAASGALSGALCGAPAAGQARRGSPPREHLSPGTDTATRSDAQCLRLTVRAVTVPREVCDEDTRPAATRLETCVH
jgi:hypothetical protein